MLHACVQRFDGMGTVQNFLETKQGLISFPLAIKFLQSRFFIRLVLFWCVCHYITACFLLAQLRNIIHYRPWDEIYCPQVVSRCPLVSFLIFAISGNDGAGDLAILGRRRRHLRALGFQWSGINCRHAVGQRVRAYLWHHRYPLRFGIGVIGSCSGRVRCNRSRIPRGLPSTFVWCSESPWTPSWLRPAGARLPGHFNFLVRVLT